MIAGPASAGGSPALVIVLLVVMAAALWPSPGTHLGDLMQHVSGRSGGRASHGRDTGVPTVGSLGTSTGSAVSGGVVKRLRVRRGARDANGGIVSVLEALARGLEAGLPPVTALTVATDTQTLRDPRTDAVAAALRHVTDAAQSGAPTPDAWSAATATEGLRPDDLDGLRAAGRAWLLSDRTGAPLATAMAAAAGQVRSARTRRRRVDSAREEARATIALLTALPLGGPVVALALGIDPIALYAHPLAGASLACGGILVFLGHRWTSALVRRALRGRELVR